MAQHRRWVEPLSVTLSLAALVVVFWLVTFVAYFDPKKSTFGSQDLLTYFYPKFTYGAAALVRGRLPLWNPHELCGLPFVATGQVAALYPVKNLIFGVLPPWLALHVNSVFHFVLAGVLAWAYARWRGLGVGAAAVAAALWTFNPTFVMSQYHPTRIMVLSWLPLVFLLWERALARRTIRAAALAGAGIALQCTAGYPPFTLCIALYLGVFTVWEVGRAGKGALGVVGTAALAAAFAFAFAAPQVLPTAELLGQSTRHDLVAEWASYAPPAPIGWGTPGAIALPIVIALVLSTGALAGFSLAGVTAGGAGVFLAALVVGQTAGTVGGTLLAGVPGYSLIRAAGFIWVMFAPFFVAMLTATGVERALERGAGGVGTAVLLVGAPLFQTALIWVVVRFFMPGLPPPGAAVATATPAFDLHAWVLHQVFMTLGLATLGALVVVARRRAWLRTPVLAAYLAVFVWGVFNAGRFADGAVAYPTVGPRPELHTALADRLDKHRVFAPLLVAHGEQMLSELPEVTGYEASLHPARVGRLVAQAGLRDYNPDWAAIGAHRRLLDLLGVARIVIDDSGAVRAAGFVPAANLPGGDAIFQNPTALPRAFVVHRARAAATPDDAFAAVVAPDFQPGDEAVVEGPAPPLAPSSVAPVVTWRTDEPERLELAVSVGAPGLLVVTDALFPGWRATVDGVAVPILRTDYAFRGVALESGTHRVEMRYRPWSFWGGVLLAAGVGAIALGARRRAPRRASPAAADATSRMSA